MHDVLAQFQQQAYSKKSHWQRFSAQPSSCWNIFCLHWKLTEFLSNVRYSNYNFRCCVQNMETIWLSLSWSVSLAIIHAVIDLYRLTFLVENQSLSWLSVFSYARRMFCSAALIVSSPLSLWPRFCVCVIQAR